MEYWYAAEQGGLEKIMSVPYGDYNHPNAGCKNCHGPVGSGGVTCARCHGEGEDNPETPPDLTPAEMQTMCLGCHARESAIIAKDDAHGTPDVHRAASMICTDCHSHREIHGDGTVYISLKEPGAMDTKCENCHTGLTGSHHTVHGTGEFAKVDCKACHQRRVVSCYNCHMDTAAPYGVGGRFAKTQIDDWVFLINGPDGKVTSANMQSFVGGDTTNTIGSPYDKTALMFAPVHSHSIMNPGRGCYDCHATATAKKIYNKRRIRLTWLDGTTLMHQTGVIPVAAGTVYKFISYDKDNLVGASTGWVELSTKPKKADLKMYRIAFGKPLTRDQMLRLMSAPYYP
jgi:hypothetical protein